MRDVALRCLFATRPRRSWSTRRCREHRPRRILDMLHARYVPPLTTVCLSPHTATTSECVRMLTHTTYAGAEHYVPVSSHTSIRVSACYCMLHTKFGSMSVMPPDTTICLSADASIYLSAYPRTQVSRTQLGVALHSIYVAAYQ